MKYLASICFALLLAIPMTSPAFVGGFALTLVAVGSAHAEPVKTGTAKKGCSIGVTGASGAQGELQFGDGDTVTVKKADGTTVKFKCSDGTWVVALTTNPAPSFDFDFKAAFTATEEEVSQACDDIKGVPTSGRNGAGYGCYNPKADVMVVCDSNAACIVFSPLITHAKTLRGLLGLGRVQVSPDTGGGNKSGASPPPAPTQPPPPPPPSSD